MLEAQQRARAIRDRLWNPPGGRVSSEIEIVSTAELQRRERAKGLATALVESLQRRRRREELFEAFIEAHKRTGFKFKPRDEDGKPVPSFEQIARATCRHFHKPRLQVFSNRRTADLVLPRQIIMYLCTELTGLSLPAIGRLLGDRDHTTVLHGARKIRHEIENDEGLAANIAAIKKAVGAE